MFGPSKVNKRTNNLYKHRLTTFPISLTSYSIEKLNQKKLLIVWTSYWYALKALTQSTIFRLDFESKIFLQIEIYYNLFSI